jgi:hypothetical protein
VAKIELTDIFNADPRTDYIVCFGTGVDFVTSPKEPTTALSFWLKNPKTKRRISKTLLVGVAPEDALRLANMILEYAKKHPLPKEPSPSGGGMLVPGDDVPPRTKH